MDKRVTRLTRRNAGFTLVELLVVMLIVAMISGVVVLNMPPPRDSQKNEAEIFAARLNLATELAIMTGSMIGLEVDQTGYRFFRFVDGEWTAHNHDQLKATKFTPDMVVEFTVTDLSLRNEVLANKDADEDEEAPSPVVFVSATGETTPLTAQFVSKRRVFSVNLDGSGNVSLETP